VNHFWGPLPLLPSMVCTQHSGDQSQWVMVVAVGSNRAALRYGHHEYKRQCGMFQLIQVSRCITRPSWAGRSNLTSARALAKVPKDRPAANPADSMQQSLC
jgi:hypothetical protein